MSPVDPTTPQRRRNAICGIREVRCIAASAAAGEQLAMQSLEGPGRTVVGAQPQHEAPAVRDRSCGPADQLLDDRLDASAFGRVAHRHVRPVQPRLAHQAQDVHRLRRQAAHQVVGVEPFDSAQDRLAEGSRSRSRSVLN